MDSPFDHTLYSTILFIDSMVALEGKPLPTMPWREIDPVGPILVLAVPQVIAEIDKRKRDGRLAKRAREFNRLIAPAVSGMPARIVGDAPTVDIGVVRCRRIDWDLFNSLDPEEPDHKVVAQILLAQDVPSERKVLISHDINPIAAASRHGLQVRQLPEHWLLDPEPGPAEKENQRLRARVRELEATQPELKLNLQFPAIAPARLYRVRALAASEQTALVAHLRRLNPADEQVRSVFSVNPSDYDSEYEDRHKLYREAVLPRYAASLHRFLEVHYGQIPFTLCLQNVGHIQAENLVVRLTASSGTLHDRFTCYPVFGPPAPRPRPFLMMPHLKFDSRDLRERAGRHDMEFAIGPNRGQIIEVHCADFRHGRSWRFEGIATIDAHAASPFTIEAEVTAANMRGVETHRFEQAFATGDAGVLDLIDIVSHAVRVPMPMNDRFFAELEAMNKDWFEFVDVDGEPMEVDDGEDDE